MKRGARTGVEERKQEKRREEEMSTSACFFFCGVQVCMNFECRSADILNYDCDVEKKCHGHGVRRVHLSAYLSVRCIRSSHANLSVCSSVRSATVTKTVTVKTAGLHLSVRSKVTAAAWTADPRGTVLT